MAENRRRSPWKAVGSVEFVGWRNRAIRSPSGMALRNVAAAPEINRIAASRWVCVEPAAGICPRLIPATTWYRSNNHYNNAIILSYGSDSAEDASLLRIQNE